LIVVYKLWHGFLPDIPKDARYTIGAKIDAALVETMEATFIASFLPRDRKLPYIEKSAAKLDLTKFFLQVAWEIKALDNKKYLLISDRLSELGRMLGGWLRQIGRVSSTTKHP
jgi:hypothetical protein